MNDGPSALEWRKIPCDLTPTKNGSPSIGLIALAGDSTIENEFHAFAPSCASVHTTRIPFVSNPSPNTLRSLEDRVPEATRLLVPGGPLDVIAFGCTSAAMAIGSERLEQIVRDARPGVRATNPTSAVVRAFQFLGFRRIALLTPYSDSVNALTELELEARGLVVASAATFRSPTSARLGRTPAPRIDPQTIARAAIELDNSRIEGVFIACTGLRSAVVINAIESTIHKPVITSNQALFWDCLRLAEYGAPVQGFGKLLERSRVSGAAADLPSSF